MNTEEAFEQDFELAIQFRATLTPETDRGCALMAAAYLDNRLVEFLTSYFVDDAEVADNMLGQDRPLGTFSSRIDLAFMLGLLSPRERRALHLIRKIRNAFGHVPEPISFNDQRIASWCRNLEELSFYKRGNHRAMFTGAVMMVLAAINFRRRQTLHCKARQDVDVERTIGPEPLDVLKAIVEFAASSPGEEDAATARLQTALAAVLEGSPEEREQVAAELAKTINERLRSSGG